MKTEIIVKGAPISEAEQQHYVNYLRTKYKKEVVRLELELDGDEVNMNYELSSVPFERIRRITGYLVGTMDRWNNAKRAEETDRVKHGTK